MPIDPKVQAPSGWLLNAPPCTTVLNQRDIDLWDEASSTSTTILAGVFEETGKGEEAKNTGNTYNNQPPLVYGYDSDHSGSQENTYPAHSESDPDDYLTLAEGIRQAGASRNLYTLGDEANMQLAIPKTTRPDEYETLVEGQRHGGSKDNLYTLDDEANIQMSIPTTKRPEASTSVAPNEMAVDMTTSHGHLSQEPLFSDISDESYTDMESNADVDSGLATTSNDDGKGPSGSKRRTTHAAASAVPSSSGLNATSGETYRKIQVPRVRRSRRKKAQSSVLGEKRKTRGTRPKRFASQYIMC